MSTGSRPWFRATSSANKSDKSTSLFSNIWLRLLLPNKVKKALRLLSPLLKTNGLLTLLWRRSLRSKAMRSREALVMRSTGRRVRTLLSRRLRRKIKTKRKPYKSKFNPFSTFSRKSISLKTMTKTKMKSRKTKTRKTTILQNSSDSLKSQMNFMKPSFPDHSSTFWEWSEVILETSGIWEIWRELRKEMKRRRHQRRRKERVREKGQTHHQEVTNE